MNIRLTAIKSMFSIIVLIHVSAEKSIVLVCVNI